MKCCVETLCVWNVAVKPLGGAAEPGFSTALRVHRARGDSGILCVSGKAMPSGQHLCAWRSPTRGCGRRASNTTHKHTQAGKLFQCSGHWLSSVRIPVEHPRAKTGPSGATGVHLVCSNTQQVGIPTPTTTLTSAMINSTY